MKRQIIIYFTDGVSQPPHNKLIHSTVRELDIREEELQEHLAQIRTIGFTINEQNGTKCYYPPNAIKRIDVKDFLI